MVARKKKTSVASTVRFKAYALVDRAVEEGLLAGYRRAHKHTDKPGEEALRDAMQEAIMAELSEIVDWYEE